MPYKLSLYGEEQLAQDAFETKSIIPTLTDLQKKAMEYLSDHKNEKRYIDANEVATYYGYPNGQYFRGVLASLHKKGLIDKKSGE
jgi:DNA-binding IscR family transcriptional regulator